MSGWMIGWPVKRAKRSGSAQIHCCRSLSKQLLALQASGEQMFMEYIYLIAFRFFFLFSISSSARM